MIKKIKHPYLILPFLFSMFTVLLQAAYIIFYKDFADILTDMLFMIIKPFTFIIFVCLICIFLSKKYPKGTKVFSCITNSLILIFQMFFISYGLMALHYISTHEDWDRIVYDNVNDYAKAKEKISCSKCIKHFPKEIPSNAKNIRFYMFVSVWKDYDEEIFLVFDTDENYINQETEKYKNIIPAKTPFRSSCNQITFDDNSYRFVEDDFEFYQIGYKKRLFNNNQAAEYGIGINKKTNTVIYYFDETDCL